MVQSKARTVEEYLKSLPPERREAIESVREVILTNLPAGYVETMNWGMISYEIPLADHPDSYNGKPLAYAGLASQKDYCALYLMSLYQDTKLRQLLLKGFEKMGRAPDMGKSCLRFRTSEELPLAVIGRIIAAVRPAALIRRFAADRKV